MQTQETRGLGVLDLVAQYTVGKHRLEQASITWVEQYLSRGRCDLSGGNMY
jgi:hypothetical protein